MRIVHHDVGIVFLGQSHHFGQRNDIAFHGKHAICDNQLDGIRIALTQTQFQVFHVVMSIFQRLSKRKATALDDGGVVKTVEQQVVVTATQSRHHTQIHLESRAEAHGFFFAYQTGKFFFQFNMDVEGAVEESGARAAGAVFVNGSLGCFLQARVVGKAQIAVGAKHQHILALDFHYRALFRFNGLIIRIDSLFTSNLWRPILRASIS